MRRILLLLAFMLSVGSNAQQATEGFEGTFPPDGWSVYNVSGPQITWQQSNPANPVIPPYQGVYAAFLNRENVQTGTAEDWLVTPQFVVSNAGVVSFHSRLTIAGNQGSIYQLRISSDPDPANIGTYELVQQWTEIEINPQQNDYNEITVVLPEEYMGEAVHVAFVMIGDMGDRWMIDEVSVDGLCPTPANLSATGMTGTEALLTWSGPLSLSGDWEVAVVHASEEFTGTGGVAVTTNSYELTDGQPGSYKFYVRRMCNDNNSNWSGPFLFTLTDDTPNVVTGTVMYDANGDTACDGEDVALPSVEVAVNINDNFYYSVYTNEDGEYILEDLPYGSNTITLQVTPPANFPAAAPVTQSVVFTDLVTEAGMNVCLPQPPSISDLSITMVPIDVARPGFEALYAVVVQNTGTTIINNASFTLSFNDERLDFVSAVPSGTVNGNVVTFSLGNITPFSTQTFNVTFDVLIPPTNIGGEELEYVATLSDVNGDLTPANNTAAIKQTIVNSYDPNDITVHEGPFILENQTGDYLTYTIRFQNTGTADAVNIRVENMLDEKLDWETFFPIISSHSYNVTRNDGKLVFNYPNIHLPDSTANEPESHGFVTYRIKPKSTFALYDIISNTAEIYFDFNPPIITNTATTEVVKTLSSETFRTSGFIVYPNPVSDKLYLHTLRDEVLNVMIYDMNGREFPVLLSSGNFIDTSSLAAGLYLIYITSDKGVSAHRIIKR